MENQEEKESKTFKEEMEYLCNQSPRKSRERERERERENKTASIFEDILAENFLKMNEDSKLQI